MKINYFFIEITHFASLTEVVDKMDILADELFNVIEADERDALDNNSGKNKRSFDERNLGDQDVISDCTDGILLILILLLLLLLLQVPVIICRKMTIPKKRNILKLHN